MVYFGLEVVVNTKDDYFSWNLESGVEEPAYTISLPL